MLYDLDSFHRLCDRPVGVGDITMVICVRAHDGNPWVMDRLRLIDGHYRPAPRVLIVDFGSRDAHARAIEALCTAAGWQHLYVDDRGTFSLARARNLGALAAETDLLFFNDVDGLGEADLFARLAAVAGAIDLGGCFDQIVDLPVYHLTAAATARATAAPGDLSRLLTRAAYTAGREVTEFVAPYSNIFLCHRRFFDMLGGYNERFRGHGSEDFEFLLRWALVSGQFPLPNRPLDDRYGPMGMDFYAGSKAYTGFRRLFELMSLQAELAGLRVAHLHHPTATSSDWHTRGDHRRAAFEAEVAPLLADPEAVWSRDFLPRARRARVTGATDTGLVLPLRLAGYAVDPAADDAVEIQSSGIPEGWRYRTPGAADPRAGAEAGDLAGDLARALGRPVAAGDLADNVAFARDGATYAFHVDGAALVARRARLSARFDTSSYAAGRLGIADVADPAFGHGLNRPRATGDWRRRLRKLTRDPRQFLVDSRIPALRRLGRRLFD